MGKSTKTTESTQTTTPAATPDLRYAIDQNRELFNLLEGREAPDFSTVAGFAPEQLQGFDLISNRALAGSPAVDAGQGAVTDIASNGAYNTGLLDLFASGGAANPYASTIASGGIDNAYLSGLAQGGGGLLGQLASGGASNPAADYFLPTARGDYLDPASNPAFGLGVEAISDSVNSEFERAGRTGSGANQSSVARGVADFASNIYNQERGRQLDAAGSLANLFNTDAANAINAQGLLGSQALSSANLLNQDSFARQGAAADLFNADVSNAFNAGSLLNSAANTRLGAAGLAPTLANQDYADLQALLGVGDARQGQSQREIADQLYKYNFPYENQIEATKLLTGSTAGLGALLGGTTTGESTETSSAGLFNSILGLGAIAGSFFGD